MVMTHALVNFSLSPRLEIWGLPLHGAGGSGFNVCSSTHAWSMLGRVAKVA